MGTFSQHGGRLILTPEDAWAAPDRVRLVAGLMIAGFLGPPLPERPDAFAMGADLPGLLIFAGCAVTFDAASFHLTLPPTSDRPRPWLGRNTRPPRCPGCRARLNDWRTPAARWRIWAEDGEGPTPEVRCPDCDTLAPLWDWDWKRHGGGGCCLIQVDEVFPDEAVPAPTLLRLLAASSGLEWRYFYMQEWQQEHPDAGAGAG